LFQVNFNQNGPAVSESHVVVFSLLASCLHGWFSQSGGAVNNCSAEMMEPMM
jgi:hypothetical protein